MTGRFTIKRQQSSAPQKMRTAASAKQKVEQAPVAKTEDVENNEQKEINEDMLTTSQKVEAFANAMAAQNAPKTVKKVKSDKGLIEKVESTKTVLTEDNRELLRD